MKEVSKSTPVSLRSVLCLQLILIGGFLLLGLLYILLYMP
jgi:hypothetical protein